MNNWTLLIVLAGTIALAQDSSPEASNSAQMERIEVTGSYIKRIDTEGPSPLVTIDREQFDSAGNNSVEDVLRDNANFEGVSNNGKDSRDGYFRFRGQHAGNTLVMLNGMRLPKEAGSFYTSIGNIPATAIERIELLKDGGSALYGADAMSGVINFITRRDMNGGQATTSFRSNLDGIGAEEKYTASYGKSYSRGSFILATEYRDNAGYTEADLGSYFKDGSKTRTLQNYGTIQSGSNSTTFGPQDCPAGTDCDVDPLIYDEIEPANQGIGVLATGTYELNDSVEVSLLTIYNQKTENNVNGPLRIAFDRSTGTGDETESIRMYSLEELGAYEVERVSDTASIQAQISKEFGATWNWRLQTSFSQQKVEESTISGDADLRIIENGMSSGISPASQDARDIINSAAVRPTRITEGSTSNARFVTAGEVMDLGDGYLSMAIGAETEIEDVAFSSDSILNTDVANNVQHTLSFPFANYSGQRQSQSVFTELSATPVDGLELSLAGRYDSYSDFGDTFNPKLSVGYRPMQSTLLRASYSTGFKPPALSDVFRPTHVRYDRAIKGERVVVSNPELTFEKSVHYSFGTVIQPNRQWAFHFDQWNWEGQGAISNFTGRHFLEFEERGLLNKISSLGARRISEDRIQVPVIFNRHRKVLRGVDMGVNYDNRTRLFNKPLSLNAETAFTHIFERREKTFEFSEWENGELFGSQNFTSIAIESQQHLFRLAARSLLNGDRYRELKHDEAYTEFDFTYGYKTPWSGRLTFTVRNLANSNVDHENSDEVESFGNASSLFSSLGRQAYLGYSQSF